MKHVMPEFRCLAHAVEQIACSPLMLEQHRQLFDGCPQKACLSFERTWKLFLNAVSAPNMEYVVHREIERQLKRGPPYCKAADGGGKLFCLKGVS